MVKKVSGLTLFVATIVLLCGCGSDDVSEAPEWPVNPCDSWDFDITYPVQDCESYSTSSDTVEISGTAFGLMGGVDCVSVMPPTITIGWRNTSTGTAGFGGHNAICLPNPFAPSGMMPYSGWVIYPGIINLQVGENIIEVTATGNGRTETSSITVYRTI